MPGDDSDARRRTADPRPGSLEPITDFEGKDEDTTAQFWSASRLARSDPKLKEAIDRLAAGLVDEVPAPEPEPVPSMVPMDADRLGGSLSRIYEEGRRSEPAASSDEMPRRPPLSAGREPGENTQPLPDVEDPTVAADDDPDDLPPEQPRPHRVDRRSAPAAPRELPSGGYDEVSHDTRPSREKTDPGGLLGPVDEFTLSLNEDLVRAARAEAAASRAPAAPAPAAPAPRRERPALPPAEPAARRARAPLPDPLTTGVVPMGGYDPLTTGVVSNPEGGRTGEGTAALMLDGLDDLVLPASNGRAEPRPAGQRGPPSEESLRLPDIQMPPPDTQRAHKMAAPGRPREAEAPRVQRETDARAEPPRREPRPMASRPPAPVRPASRPSPEAPRPESRPAPPAGPPAPSTAAVKRLEDLLTLADEPPEREETISSSMELLSIADAPPEKEETIGADLVRVDRLQTVAEAPPAGEESVGGMMQRVDDSVDDLVLPPSVGKQQDRRRPTSQPPPRPQQRPGARPGAPQRPQAEEATVIERAVSPATVPLPHRTQLSDESTRPISVPSPAVQRAPPKALVSSQLRRETWRPTPTPAPEAPRSAPQARREGPVPGLPPESTGGGLQDSVLVWAGTFASLLIGGGMVLFLLILVAYIV